MKKRNFLSLFVALGLLCCSFTAQAMEEEAATQHTTKLKKDEDHRTSDEIKFTEDFMRDCEEIDSDTFWRALFWPQFYTKNGAIYCYKNHDFEMNEEDRKSLIGVLSAPSSRGKILKMIAIYGNDTLDGQKKFDGHKFFYNLQAGERLTHDFNITFLTKDQVERREAKAHSCWENLNKTHPGKHVVDYCLDYMSYYSNKGIGLSEGDRRDWKTISLVEYGIDDRRQEYEAASPDRKREMLEETNEFREKESIKLEKRKEILKYIVILHKEKENIKKRLKEIEKAMEEKEEALKNL